MMLRQSLEQQRQADVCAAVVFLPLCVALGWWTYDATGALLPFISVAVAALWYLIQQVRLARTTNRVAKRTGPTPDRHTTEVVYTATSSQSSPASPPEPVAVLRWHSGSTTLMDGEGDKAHARTNSIPRLQHRPPV